MNHNVIAVIIALLGILIGLACVIGLYSPSRLIKSFQAAYAMSL